MVKEGRCPICGERGFPYQKPVKANGRSYKYLYYGHYSREKYRKGGKSHLRWCYVGKYADQGNRKQPNERINKSD